MKKILMLLMATAVSLSAMAFNFAGKTFRGTTEDADAGTMTVKFRNGSRMTITVAAKGMRTQTVSAQYEQSGGIINVYHNNGAIDYLYLADTEDGISMYIVDDYGNPALWLYEIKSSPAKESSTTKRRTPSKKKRR